MGNETMYYKIPKPDEDDFYDIAEFNKAMDILDETLADMENKKLDRDGDVSDTEIKTLDTITEEFPVPAGGEPAKTFLGKVKKFIEDTKGRYLEADMTVYVAATGSDETGDGSSAAPYATITKALSVIPKNLNSFTATINIVDGTYNEDVVVTGFSSGALLIQSTAIDSFNDNCIVKSLMIHSCTGNIAIKYLTIHETIGQIPMQVVFVHSCSLSYIKCNVTNPDKSGISVWGAEALIEYCNISNHNEAIIAQRNSTVCSYNNTGTNNQVGLLTASGSIINKGSIIQPHGQNLLANYTGVIVKSSGAIIGSLQNDTTYYIATTGSDTTGDGSQVTPFRTIQHSIDILPKDLGGHDANIKVVDGTYNEDIQIRAFSGGVITLSSVNGTQLNENCKIKSIICENVSGRIYMSGLNLTTIDNHCFQAINCPDVILQYVTINVVSSYTGFHFDGCRARLEYCLVANHNTALNCYNSICNSSDWNTSSTGNNEGIVNSYGGLVYLQGNQPTATTNLINYGGMFINQNGTQISDLITSGLSCTWGNISGGYIRHGNIGAAMVTINFFIHTTATLSAYTDYIVYGFPAPYISSVAVTMNYFQGACLVDIGTNNMRLRPFEELPAGADIVFSATYPTNS